MEVFTVKAYIESKTSLMDRVLAIESLIDAMLLNMIDFVSNSGTKEYTMDDGQIKVSTEYRSIDEVAEAVKGLEKIKNIYINRHNGYLTTLRGRKNY
jgi:hypothetical protein